MKNLEKIQNMILKHLMESKVKDLQWNDKNELYNLVHAIYKINENNIVFGTLHESEKVNFSDLREKSLENVKKALNTIENKDFKFEEEVAAWAIFKKASKEIYGETLFQKVVEYGSII